MKFVNFSEGEKRLAREESFTIVISVKIHYAKTDCLASYLCQP